MDQSQIVAAIERRRAESRRDALRTKLMDNYCYTPDAADWLMAASDDEVHQTLILVSGPDTLPKREANPEPGSPEPPALAWFTFGLLCGMALIALPILAIVFTTIGGAK